MARKTLNPLHKQQLEEMADVWALLASARRKQLQKAPVVSASRDAVIEPREK
jgi:hypothetical protein